MLLVGAFAPCEGPWISMEEGEWRLETLPEGANINVRLKGGEEYIVDRELRVVGPGWIQAKLTSGNNISLSLIQVARA